MTKQNVNEGARLLEAAETAVAEIEALEAGKPWKEISTAASEAVVGLTEYATAHVFPSAPVPVGADTVADFDLYTRETPRVDYGKELAQLHLCSLDSNPDLATFLRSAAVCRRVSMMGAGMAGAYNRPAAEMATEALQQYRQAIAAQLHERGELEPFSRIIASDLPALQARITGATESREMRDAEARKQELRARLERRKNLARCFRRASMGVRLSGKQIGRRDSTVTAQEIAELLLRGALDAHLDYLEQWLVEEGFKDSRFGRSRRVAIA